MMKFSVALMVLLHVCLSFSLNMDLNNELIRELKNLNTNHSALLTVTHVPSHRMQINAKRCLGVFIKKLRNIVSNVTVREESIVRGIKAHLRDMEEHEDAVQQRNQDHQSCIMVARKGRKQPFLQFINFLRELNSS